MAFMRLESLSRRPAGGRPSYPWSSALRCMGLPGSWRALVVACGSALGLLPPGTAHASSNVHVTWLWHLHQPIYWPGQRTWGGDHYEAAWDTIQQQDAGRPHPKPEVLRDIFGLADRVNAYQTRPRDALKQLSAAMPTAGAQVSYSGALMENVQSLGRERPAGLRQQLVFLQSAGALLDHHRRQAAPRPGQLHLSPRPGAVAQR